MPCRKHALAIWQAGVEAVRPENCLESALEQLESTRPDFLPWTQYPRILVGGGGKAGAAMSQALEAALAQRGVDPARVGGLVNVPSETVRPLRSVRLFPARPGGTNQPTEQAMAGTREILRLMASATSDDVAICLLSGGGSALLPAPVPGVSLADKQALTALLHRSGATINEMNAVRKHLSLIKGGGLVRCFSGQRMLSLIISDVIGDPLNVIASGPTCVDSSTFADAWAVLERFHLVDQAPRSVLAHLERGVEGKEPETLKELPRSPNGKPLVENVIIANNRMALTAAGRKARGLGYRLLDLGDSIGGDTELVASVLADITLGQRRQVETQGSVAILSGGETTVTLPAGHGKGGRNQEFVLAFLNRLQASRMEGITVLCGGTDGEDGPTDAAGAMGDSELLHRAEPKGLSPADYLRRHDAYHFFEPLAGLVKTGQTETNVMDLRVILVTS